MILTGVFGLQNKELVAIIHNEFPLLTVFRLMACDVLKPAATMLITSPIIGNTVDKNIHFVTHYCLYLLKGQNIGEAVSTNQSEMEQVIPFATLILISLFLCCITENLYRVSTTSSFWSCYHHSHTHRYPVARLPDPLPHFHPSVHMKAEWEL